MGWLYIPLGSSFSQIVKGECTINIKVIHSSLFRRSDFLWGRLILHMGTLIWVDMINIGTKLPDFMKLEGIRQSPLPQCVLEIVITVVAHLVSTSCGYYMNQLPAIDRPWSCTRLRSVSPPVVSDVSTNRRLGSSGSGPVSSKTPLHCCWKWLWYYGNSFVFFRVSLPIYKTAVTLFLTSWNGVRCRAVSSGIPLYCTGLGFLFI